MGLLSALLLVATVAAVLYLFLIRPTPVAVAIFLAVAAAFVWSWAPALLEEYGSVPAVLPLAAIAVGVPVLFGLALLFRSRPLVLVWALVLTMPLRVPIPAGDQTAFLLVPLYLVVLAGFLSIVEPREDTADSASPAKSSPGGLGSLLEPGAGALWRQDRLRLPLAGLVAIAGLSLLWTAGPVAGVIRFLCFWVAFSLAYHVVTVRLADERARRHAAMVLLGSGAVLAAIGIVQRLTGVVFYNLKVSEGFFEATSMRVNSLFWDPNMFGRFLVVVIIFAIVELIARRSRLMIALATTSLLLSLPVLALTFSRSGWIALAAAVILLAWRFLGAGKAAAVAVALLLVVVVVFTVIDAPQFNIPKYARARYYWEKFFGGRLGLIQGGVAMFAAHPIGGVGLGGFPSAFPRYRPPDYKWKVVESHNSRVTTAAELGLIGMTLFVWLIAMYCGVAKHLWRERPGGGPPGAPANAEPPNSRTDLEPSDSRADIATLGVAAVVATAAIFVHSFFYGAFFEDPFTWFMLALSGAMTVGVTVGDPRRRQGSTGGC